MAGTARASSAITTANTHLNRAAKSLLDRLRARRHHESEARYVAEQLALILQAALLTRHAPPAVADTFCATRLGQDGGRSFGILPGSADVAGIMARQGG